jgi:hypothetical protein
MTVFTMFFIELMASRFDVFGEQHASDLEKSDPAKELMRGSEKYDDTDLTLQKGKHYPLVCHWVSRASCCFLFISSALDIESPTPFIIILRLRNVTIS